MAGRDGRDVSHIKTKSHFITLKKGRAGFGFNILGGIDKPCYPGNCGIYVAKIRENESAALDGRLREGDRILEAGGISLDNILHEDAAKVFRNTTNDALVLRIERQGEPDFGEEMSPSNKWSPSQTLQNSGVGHTYKVACTMADVTRAGRLGIDTKCWSNSAGQAASLERRNG
ncbi:synaptojanin-2-binding protein-like isoform X2 [Leucoraja erinacea]|uniref:synaptojanin-2-binding protein-like isoform X2 n=1 Tax=Leucoraja erinaceus TaxID=7782 RepID=UPI0024588077|nr:synaptojanin-2-binding protein-like isoform X2 [Leucoraja erinacea]